MSTQTDAPAAFATAVATTKQQVAPVTTATIKKVLNDDFENDKKLDQYQIDRLMEQGYTKGLAMSFNTLKSVFPLRIFIVDNSSSMNQRDGHRVVVVNDDNNRNNSGSKVRMAPCTRWEELHDSIKYHINLAGLLHAPTKFRLLNQPLNGMPQEFSVATSSNTRGSSSTITDTQTALKSMNLQPHGNTPLAKHLRAVQKEVSSMVSSHLLHAGQKVVIVIATDGMPTDCTKDQFVNCLRELEGLPVWVVIRLCTDDDNIVSYYNDLDTQLELSIEVLDDYVGEAKEVYDMNPWLNYTLAIHRLREFGYHDRVFDLLDEKLLSKLEMKDFCSLLFGNDGVSIPEPSLEWEAFLDYVDARVKKEKYQWNPMLKRTTPLINSDVLKYSHTECTCTIL